MQQEQIPFNVLAQMEKGELPMTEEGRLQIAKWEDLTKPSITEGNYVNEVDNNTQDGSAFTRLSSKQIGDTEYKSTRKSVFEILTRSNRSNGNSIVSKVDLFQDSMKAFQGRLSYVSAKLGEIRSTTEEVYKNEKKFYKKMYGLKIPYEQFWDLYMKKHGDRSIPDVLANTDYETIAEDYAEFVSERMSRRRMAIKESELDFIDNPNPSLLPEQLLITNNPIPMPNSTFEIRDNYDKAIYDVAYLKRLDEYDLNRVYEYAQGRWMNSVQIAAGLMQANPNYPYPESYRNGHELDYWLDHESQAQRCKAVKHEIDRLRSISQIPQVQPILPTSPASQSFVTQEKNLFNGMPLDEVKVYFMQLATEKSSNGKPFLTCDEVAAFIGRAFIGKTELPKLCLNYANGEKKFVWSLFYQFYVRCTTNYQYESTVRCKAKYIDLVNENFTNFNRKELEDNLHKTATRKWSSTN